MKKSVAVLGLGKFGSSIARSLAKGGAEVLAVLLSIPNRLPKEKVIRKRMRNRI